MAAIVLTNLKSARSEQEISPSELYTDISLDFKINQQTKDLEPSYDEEAIKNYVSNILNTYPGENLLFPDLGLNISKSLFEPISKFNGELLGESVVRSIKKYEPRVTVQNVFVQTNIDEQQYTVTIVVVIPTLGKRVSFNSIFTRDGIYFIKDK